MFRFGMLLCVGLPWLAVPMAAPFSALLGGPCNHTRYGSHALQMMCVSLLVGYAPAPRTELNSTQGHHGTLRPSCQPTTSSASTTTYKTPSTHMQTCLRLCCGRIRPCGCWTGACTALLRKRFLCGARAEALTFRPAYMLARRGKL